MLSRLNWKHFTGFAMLLAVFALGWTAGFSAAARPWEVAINGKPATLPVHVIKNMLFVSLEDLSQLPGWSVEINLGSRKVSIRTPAAADTQGKNPPPAGENTQPENRKMHEPPSPPPPIEARNGSAGPPDNVRMTVQAALGTIEDLQKSLDGSVPADQVQKRMDDTAGIVRQAINLLIPLPRTRTIQADLLVTLEDLQSQVSLFLAKDQSQDGILPWTHPTAQSLLLKYPDLRPCHVSKGKLDGLDEQCGKNMLGELETEDIQDVQRDLNAY